MNLVSDAADRYDIVIVGSGFAATFFLKRYLEQASPRTRILVLERGRLNDHAWQASNRAYSDIDEASTYVTGGQRWEWQFTVGFGGGSNCWVGNTPRPTPNDMRMKTLYGVGRDWPVPYEEVEPYFEAVEQTMNIAGPDVTWTPRRAPYAQSAHRLSPADRLVNEARPDVHLPVPCARQSVTTAERLSCCGNYVCSVCPVDAKFSILNGMMDVYRDPRVSVLLGAEAQSVELSHRVARGVRYRTNAQERFVGCDLVILAANALFNPFLLQRSGYEHPLLGRRLHCRLSTRCEVFLDGVDHYGGGSVLGCLNYAFYDGAFRSERASMVIETSNTGRLRAEPGRWRQVMPLLVKLEDLPDDDNRVTYDPAAPDRPVVTMVRHSDYAMKTYHRLEEQIAAALSPLPIERVKVGPVNAYSPHIEGTTMMGRDPADSVIDADQLLHDVRNLACLGAGGLVSANHVNPTLILSAFAMRTADRLSA